MSVMVFESVAPADRVSGKRLRDLRLKHGLRRRDAARCSWVSEANLRALESGDMRVTLYGDAACAEEAIERAYQVVSLSRRMMRKAQG